MNLPEEFIQRIEAQFADESEELIASILHPPQYSARLHPHRGINPFANQQIIPWCDNGRYGEHRPSYGLDPYYHAGCYYPQEASSMLIEEVVRSLDLSHALFWMDLCAAPGGKSTHLLSLIASDAVLLSNEIVPKRYSILKENLTRWGYLNHITTCLSPSQLARMGNFFDVILVDAPCSGEGLFRKDEDWRSHWSQSNSTLCVKRQEDILHHATQLLKPGGTLIYTTCTLNPDENEKQIHKLLSTDIFESMALSSLLQYGCTEVSCHIGKCHGYYALPHRLKGEPFFLAVLRKTTDQVSPARMTKVSESKTRAFTPDHILARTMTYRQLDEVLLPEIPRLLELSNLMHHFQLKHDLPVVGKLIKGHIHPTPLAAFAEVYEKDSMLELNQIDSALTLLRHESIGLPISEKGWYVATYNGAPLLWIKYDGRRINIKHPLSWRLKKK